MLQVRLSAAPGVLSVPLLDPGISGAGSPVSQWPARWNSREGWVGGCRVAVLGTGRVTVTPGCRRSQVAGRPSPESAEQNLESAEQMLESAEQIRGELNRSGGS